MDALFHAVLDRRRLLELDCPARSTMAHPLANPQGEVHWKFYYGLDYRALPHAPWCPGTIYIYRKADFAPDYQTVPYLTNQPIRPITTLNVNPWDWPLLDRAYGVDLVSQTERQQETFQGYPWSEDPTIHPNIDKRAVVNAARSYLESHYADSIDLPRLGGIVGLSPFTLLRQFSAHIGLSPREFQTQQRITEAKRLLRKGLPIAQVAAETGFCDQTHLNRHLRRIVGLTAGQYVRAQESPIRFL